MSREFNRNMFIMLFAIMIGAIIITYFAADITRQTQIDELTESHVVEIAGINNKNENFTDNFLEGSLRMDSARETREVANYYFDFAFFWYNTALANTTNMTIQQCVENCTDAMNQYLTAYEKFGESKPSFKAAKNFTDKEKYIEVLGYYERLSDAGKNITILRYNMSSYLMKMAQNLSIGNMSNIVMLEELFNETMDLYGGALEEYEELKDQIDEYTFFEEDRTKPGQ